MNTRTASLWLSAAALAVAVPVAWALTPPAWIDEEYRQCVGDAVDHEMEQRIETEKSYNDAQVRDLEAYRDAVRSAWQIADENERKDRINDADKAYKDAARESKKTYDARIKESRNESRDAQRECKTARSDHQKFIRNMCMSTADCKSGRVCSTERGVCDPSCPEGAEHCQQVCAGTCERSSSSRSSASSRSSSSRSTSFRSSSSSSNNGGHQWDNYQTNGQVCRGSTECTAGYFCSTTLGECNSACAAGQVCTQVCTGKCLLYPIIPPASSSVGGTPGSNCSPYRCADGREVPSCDGSGNPINYFQNPCYS